MTLCMKASFQKADELTGLKYDILPFACKADCYGLYVPGLAMSQVNLGIES